MVITGDCHEYLPVMASSCVDVVCTSPPYNIGTKYHAYDDHLEELQYHDKLADIAQQLQRVLKPNGSFFLNIGHTSIDPWLAVDIASIFREFFVLQNKIIWVKAISIQDRRTGTWRSTGQFKPVNSERYITRCYEEIYHFTHDGSVKVDCTAIGVPYEDKTNISRRGHANDKRDRGNCWFIPYTTIQRKSDRYNHPSSFPIELPRMCIALHGGKSLTVLDPYCGVGTTLVAAAQLGHNAIGIDIDASYSAVATERYQAAMAEQCEPDDETEQLDLEDYIRSHPHDPGDRV